MSEQVTTIEYLTNRYKGEPEEWKPAEGIQLYGYGRADVLVRISGGDVHGFVQATALRINGAVAWDIREEAF